MQGTSPQKNFHSYTSIPFSAPATHPLQKIVKYKIHVLEHYDMFEYRNLLLFEILRPWTLRKSGISDFVTMH